MEDGPIRDSGDPWRPTQGVKIVADCYDVAGVEGKGPLRSESVEAVPESDLECAFLSQ